jgi:hypothetical protein
MLAAITALSVVVAAVVAASVRIGADPPGLERSQAAMNGRFAALFVRSVKGGAC